MNAITFIHYIIFLIAAALQYEESMGYCLKPDGNHVSLGPEAKDIPDLVADSTKESCLSQCLLVEGVKGCEYERAVNYGSVSLMCMALMVEVTGGDDDADTATCWKFLEKGELLYAEKQFFSEP